MPEIHGRIYKNLDFVKSFLQVKFFCHYKPVSPKYSFQTLNIFYTQSTFMNSKWSNPIHKGAETFLSNLNGIFQIHQK